MLIREKDYLMHYGIKGMKWGVRRYQDKNGKRTDAGKRRYERDAREKGYNSYDDNAEVYRKGKGKGEQLDFDAYRYAKEDIERSRRLTDSISSMNRNLMEVNNRSIRNRKQERMDLSNMSDREMRERINRELLERQYNDVFNRQKVSKGREYLGRTLDATGTILTIGSSALGIALAIKELRGR